MHLTDQIGNSRSHINGYVDQLQYRHSLLPLLFEWCRPLSPLSDLRHELMHHGGPAAWPASWGTKQWSHPVQMDMPWNSVDSKSVHACACVYACVSVSMHVCVCVCQSLIYLELAEPRSWGRRCWYFEDSHLSSSSLFADSAATFLSALSRLLVAAALSGASWRSSCVVPLPGGFILDCTA